MREILFRGKNIDNGHWMYGVPISLKNGETYMNFEFMGWIDRTLVIPETVGQYTGLTDKNGVKIFEGDICWFYGGDYYSGLWEQNAIVAITDMTDDEQTHYLNNAEYCEVVGNVFDNSELLEGKS